MVSWEARGLVLQMITNYDQLKVSIAYGIQPFATFHKDKNQSCAMRVSI